MNDEHLWGAIFLAAGAYQAWRLYRFLDSGKWEFWLQAGRVPILVIDRRPHPIAFWFCVAWEVFVMVFLIALGAWAATPVILPILGK